MKFAPQGIGGGQEVAALDKWPLKIAAAFIDLATHRPDDRAIFARNDEVQ
ncbi:MAG: hypothetical protein IPM07_03115 [Anaerolineales bacterium]|nr:hypothetical protein [Anaerolineales bacterium]